MRGLHAALQNLRRAHPAVTVDSVHFLWEAETGLEWTHYEDSDDWVVHNPASANIQLVTASTRALSVLLTREGPKTTETLAAAFASDGAQVLDEDFVLATEEALKDMDRAGLVRRLPL